MTSKKQQKSNNISMKQSNDKPEYSIIIPIYNEEAGLSHCLEELIEKLGAEPYELILVNDGSTDGTAEIIRNFDKGNLIHLTHEFNRGYGAAIKTGISHSSSEIIVITDADGTYPNEEIPRLVNLLNDEHSMVVGSRTGDNVRIPFLRRLPKLILNKLADYLTRSKIPDLNSGLRVIRKEVVMKFYNILPDSFSLTTTITLAVLTNNMQIIYTPINYYKRKGNSKIRPINDTLNFVQLIIRTVLYFEPLRIFIPFSAGLFILGILVYLFGLFFLPYSLDITSSIIISTAIIVLTVGMLADLIDKKLSR